MQLRCDGVCDRSVGHLELRRPRSAFIFHRINLLRLPCLVLTRLSLASASMDPSGLCSAGQTPRMSVVKAARSLPKPAFCYDLVSKRLLQLRHTRMRSSYMHTHPLHSAQVVGGCDLNVCIILLASWYEAACELTSEIRSCHSCGTRHS
jgi:hypothetical protein